ncbi:lactoylglutathione lyase [Paenibacillus taichungensis]|uniref:lactoylglutathione lyase n=1 Tax=Paenibacillus taichungensis TaxID=484184 RepID=UPI0039A4F40A
MVSTPLEEVVARLTHQNIKIEEGPIKRTGALGPICSVYIRDPNGNLIELSNALYA